MIEDLIASYLFKNKKCPLPSVGTLDIVDGNAATLLGEMKITAPQPVIRFTSKETPSADLVKYIAVQNNISVSDAEAALNEYSQKLGALQTGEEANIPGTGKFYMVGESLHFTPQEIPAAFFPAVAAQRVIHPFDSHDILVGDTQTTNTVMTDFYNETTVKPRSRWWIWAIVLFVIAMAILLMYFNDKGHNASFGNAQSYTPAS